MRDYTGLVRWRLADRRCIACIIKVPRPPQHAQRAADGVRAGTGMAGEELLPPTPLEHEMCVCWCSWLSAPTYSINGLFDCFCAGVRLLLCYHPARMLSCRYRSVEAAIRQLNMEPSPRMRKRSRAPDIDLSMD